MNKLYVFKGRIELPVFVLYYVKGDEHLPLFFAIF